MSIRKLVLFDIDGTLLVTKGATRASNALAIQETFGVTVDVMTHPFGGKTDWQILREVLERYGITGKEIGQKMSAYEHAFARQLSAVIHNFDGMALPGAHTLVNALDERDDVLVGLVTGNTSMTAAVKLQALDFEPETFVVGAFGSEADDRNLLPKLALDRAIRLTKQDILPADVIIVGDTVKDVACARALGGVAVTVFTGYEARENIIHAQPDYMLEDLTQFLETVPLA